MNPFLVAFDLYRPSQHYAELFQAMEDLHACKVLRSVWLLESPRTAAEIRNDLVELVDESDSILVIRVIGTYSTYLDDDAIGCIQSILG